MTWTSILATREPRPQLLGLELEPFPYLSALSVLMRVTRLMALETGEWFRTVGIRFSAGRQDILAGKASRARFGFAMGLGSTQVPVWWDEEAWSPLRTGGLLDHYRQPARWCWECATYGFHTTLFQLPFIDRCPWHNASLLDRCPHCKKPGSAFVDSLGQLGRCDCGFDWLIIDRATVQMWDFPTSKAESWMSSYLAWATEERRHRHVVVPERATNWRSGYAVLAEPPEHIRHPCGRAEIVGTRVTNFDDTSIADPDSSQLWGWGALADPRPLTYVALPARTHERLAVATQMVIDQLSSHGGTPLEVAVVPSTSAAPTPRSQGMVTLDRFIPPYGAGAEGSTWLDLSALDLDTLQLCGRLLHSVATQFDPAPAEIDRSRQAARTDSLGRIRGRGLLAAALEEVLIVGYRQGLSAILLADQQLGSPSEWWLPIVEFKGTSGCVERLRACWIQTPAPRLGRARLPPVQCSPPRKKSRCRKRPRLGRRAEKGAIQR